MGISLRSAVIISAVIHAALVAPFYNQHLLGRDIARRNSVVVDYVVLKEMAAAASNSRGFLLNTSEAQGLSAQKDVAVKPQPVVQKDDEFRKKLEARKLTKAGKVRAAPANNAKPKSNKDYAAYYQFIRERIRARLKDNYRYYNREGDVCLAFTLGPNGALLAYEIDRARSVQDEVLLHIAATSLKAVSPFPPIPKSLVAPKTTFSIIISFKK